MTSAAEEPENGKELFSVQLRKATKNIHDLSDALVNAKLGVTISDDSVWAEGLLVFYEVFKFLEKSLNSHSDSLIGDLLIPDMARTEAFEEDLDFFFGDWREGYQIRPEVRLYLDHLESLDQENPYLLIPYIYHLYMGLFSGGQILAAKVNELIELGQLHSVPKKISHFVGQSKAKWEIFFGTLCMLTLFTALPDNIEGPGKCGITQYN